MNAASHAAAQLASRVPRFQASWLDTQNIVPLRIASGSSRESYIRSLSRLRASHGRSYARLATPRSADDFRPEDNLLDADLPPSVSSPTSSLPIVTTTVTSPNDLVDRVYSIAEDQFAEMHASLATPRRSRPRLMRAAEGEWLQEEDETNSDSVMEDISSSSPTPTPNKPHQKFDWKAQILRRNDRIIGQQNGIRSKAPRRYKPTISSLGSSEPFYHEVKAYGQRFQDLLNAEQAAEESIIKERLTEWPLEKLREEGYCLVDLSAFWLEATHFGRPVAAFSLGPGQTLGFHHFNMGSQVMVSQKHPHDSGTIVGSVVSKTATQLKICFDIRHAGLEDELWRLDLGSSDISYQRMRTAINSLNADPVAQAASSSVGKEVILQATSLRDILLRGFADTSSDSMDSSSTSSHVATTSPASEDGIFSEYPLLQDWARRYEKENPVAVEGDPIIPLNEPQVRSIATMLANRMSLIQGPPGTGKTRTVIETVKLLKQHYNVPIPILVCTYTNVAVDNLVEGFAKGNLKPLRVGFAARVRPELHSHTLDAKLEAHPSSKELDKIKADLILAERRYERAVKKRQDAKNPTDWSKLEDTADKMERRVQGLRKGKYSVERQMLFEILTEADVICTTCITSACAALQMIDFPLVFIDEASMSTEPAVLIPIMKGAQHVALIGDHKQLPPVVTSPEAEAGGLALSLFERLITEGDVPTVMLDRQYRMHPSISQFPSEEFYNKRLFDGTIDHEGHISDALLPPKSAHLPTDLGLEHSPSAVFLDHAGPEARKDRSLINQHEALIVCSIVEDLLLNNPSITGKDIGIIAPYAAQIKLLDRLLTVDPESRERFISVLGRHRALETPEIEVKTVDGFEGREKDIIIFSTVRNNAGGHIGFLADRRRLNVGLTRAKRGLFVVGSMKTLREGRVGIFGNPESVSMTSVGGGMGMGMALGGGMSRREEGQVWRRYIDFMQDRQLVRHWHSMPEGGGSLRVATAV